MRLFVITKNYENIKIYNVIKKRFPNLNTSTLNKAFRKKDIKVNGHHVDKEYIVHLDDVVKLYIPDNILFNIKDTVYYAYEDENILVAYKPKGIETTAFNKKNADCMLYFDDLVKSLKGENLKVCHRLDINTEGLVIFTKNDQAYNQILTGFKNNNIHKTYLAAVYKNTPKKHDILKNYIVTKNGFSKIYDTPFKDSKECITEYTNIYHLNNLSILNIVLHTGRTHQIRAVMKHINCPIIGDPKYSTNEINNMFKLYSQVLYAAKYEFNFPNDSFFSYLNDVCIDYSGEILKKIYSLFKL